MWRSLAQRASEGSFGTWQEIFAVQVLPGVRRPNLIDNQPRLIADSFVVPDEVLDLVPAPLCHPARVTQ